MSAQDRQERWRAKNPGLAAERASEWYHNNRERARQQQREYIAANPDKVKAGYRRRALRKFGLTVEDYDTMLENQTGRCAVCGGTCSSGRRLAVDHCHSTGVVRGLLCAKCNQGIGLFADVPETLEAAAAYLRKAQR